MDKKRVATLFLIVLMDTAGAATIVPLVPVYVVAQFHATPLEAGLLLAVYYAAQVLAAPWLGKLSDRFGRRPILLLSQTGTIVSYLLIVLAVPLGAALDHADLRPGIAAGLVVIFLARALDGVTGGNVSVAQAYASDISTPDQRTRALGLIGGAFGLGFILGPALVGLLALLAPTLLVAPLLAAALASVVTLLLTLRWLREPLRHAEGQGERSADTVPLAAILRRVPALLVMGTTLLVGSYMAALAGTFSLYADQVLFAGQSTAAIVRNVGIIQTVLGVVLVLTQVVLLKPLVSRLGERKLLLLGTLVQLVSALGLFSIARVGAVIGFMIVFGLGYGTAWPTLQSLMTQFGPKDMAGRMLGVLQSVNSLALILSMVWGTYVFGTVSPRAVFGVSAALLALAVVGSVGISRHQPEPEAGGPGGSGAKTGVETTAVGTAKGAKYGQPA